MHLSHPYWEIHMINTNLAADTDWVPASCQVSSKCVQQLQQLQRSLKYFSKSEARAAILDFWLARKHTSTCFLLSFVNIAILYKWNNAFYSVLSAHDQNQGKCIICYHGRGQKSLCSRSLEIISAIAEKKSLIMASVLFQRYWNPYTPDSEKLKMWKMADNCWKGMSDYNTVYSFEFAQSYMYIWPIQSETDWPSLIYLPCSPTLQFFLHYPLHIIQ